MWNAFFFKYTLNFRFPVNTSRGTLYKRDVYFLKLNRKDNADHIGLGECAPLKGLSRDDLQNYEVILKQRCEELNHCKNESDFFKNPMWQYLPSMRFGFEMALADLNKGGERYVFENDFLKGKLTIPIHGLIWMGHPEFMKKQIDQKVRDGFRCLKIKIGALDFEAELEMLSWIRKKYKEEDISIRLDANGAFTPETALEKIERLSDLRIHSIEQPIATGQWKSLALLCEKSPVPIALDEELIHCISLEDKKKVFEKISPQAVVLKPSLLGGFMHTREWIDLARFYKVDWWMTSALESNLALNAICQFTAENSPSFAQGLGTGSLYLNNLSSPLKVSQGKIGYNPKIKWSYPPILGI